MAQKSLNRTIDTLAGRARAAADALTDVPQRRIDRVLRATAKLVGARKQALERANRKDLAAARKKGLSPAMIDRLTLSEKTLKSMIAGLKQVATLSTCVGKRYEERTRPNGLRIGKMRVPVGVISIIYESRPNVTIDAAALCLKSHNAVILRGGSEAFHSNRALAGLLRESLKEGGLPPDAVQLVPTTERRAIDLLLAKEDELDLVIPRGGEGLIKTVVEKSRIPVIKHYKGVCHVFVSRKADMKLAVPIVTNAKVQRPGVCNAMETLLLDRGLSEKNRANCVEALLQEGVKLFGDPASRKLSPGIGRATEADWEAEYLDLHCAVRTVDGLQGAIEHINRYGSHHTDAIVSRSKTEANEFLKRVDSSSVMVNASTRFSDGGEYGMGCEIGISTDKLHARGPMGIDDLTTYKWVVEGTGQVRG